MSDEAGRQNETELTPENPTEIKPDLDLFTIEELAEAIKTRTACSIVWLDRRDLGINFRTQASPPLIMGFASLLQDMAQRGYDAMVEAEAGDEDDDS